MGQICVTRNQAATNESWLVRCSLALWDLAETICIILTMGGSPFCSHGGFLAVTFLPSLPTHLTPLSQWAQPLQISTQTPPRVNTQLQQSTNNLLHRLHTFTLLLPLDRHPLSISPQNLPLLLFYACISTTHTEAIATDTFVTSMQPYPSQPNLSRGTHLLIKTVSIGSSHVSPLLTIEPLLSVASPSFFHWNSSNTLQKINKVSIDSETPPHRLFSCSKENSLFWR